MSKIVYKTTLKRTGDNVVEATGGTDGRVVMGPKGTPNSFTPVELLLVAIAGCSGMDLCTLSQRDGLDLGEFTLRLRGSRPVDAKQLDKISVQYEVPGGSEADVERLVAEVSELCTVALTVRSGCAVDHERLATVEAG